MTLGDGTAVDGDARTAAVRRRRHVNLPSHIPGDDSWRHDYHDPTTGEFAPLGYVSPSILKKLLSSDPDDRIQAEWAIRSKLDKPEAFEWVQEFARTAGPSQLLTARKIRREVLGVRPAGSTAEKREGQQAWDKASDVLAAALHRRADTHPARPTPSVDVPEVHAQRDVTPDEPTLNAEGRRIVATARGRGLDVTVEDPDGDGPVITIDAGPPGNITIAYQKDHWSGQLRRAGATAVEADPDGFNARRNEVDTAAEVHQVIMALAGKKRQATPGRGIDRPEIQAQRDGGSTWVGLADWETTEPWNIDRAVIDAGDGPGWLRVGEGRGTEMASQTDDSTIMVTPEFFDQPAEVRRAVLYHEAGHRLSDITLGVARDSDGNKIDVDGVDAVEAFQTLARDPARWVPSQGTPGEMVAEAYALLHTDPQQFADREPELFGWVVDQADRHRFPIPDPARTVTPRNLVFRANDPIGSVTDVPAGTRVVDAVGDEWVTRADGGVDGVPGGRWDGQILTPDKVRPDGWRTLQDIPAPDIAEPVEATELDVPVFGNPRDAARATGKVRAKIVDQGRLRKFKLGDELEVGYYNEKYAATWTVGRNGKRRKHLVAWDRLGDHQTVAADGAEYHSRADLVAAVADGPQRLRVADGRLWRLGVAPGDYIDVEPIAGPYGEVRGRVRHNGQIREVNFDRFDAIGPEPEPVPAPDVDKPKPKKLRGKAGRKAFLEALAEASDGEFTFEQLDAADRQREPLRSEIRAEAAKSLRSIVGELNAVGINAGPVIRGGKLNRPPRKVRKTDQFTGRSYWTRNAPEWEWFDELSPTQKAYITRNFMVTPPKRGRTPKQGLKPDEMSEMITNRLPSTKDGQINDPLDWFVELADAHAAATAYSRGHSLSTGADIWAVPNVIDRGYTPHEVMSKDRDVATLSIARTDKEMRAIYEMREAEQAYKALGAATQLPDDEQPWSMSREEYVSIAKSADSLVDSPDGTAGDREFADMMMPPSVVIDAGVDPSYDDIYDTLTATAATAGYDNVHPDGIPDPEPADIPEPDIPEPVAPEPVVTEPVTADTPLGQLDDGTLNQRRLDLIAAVSAGDGTPEQMSALAEILTEEADRADVAGDRQIADRKRTGAAQWTKRANKVTTPGPEVTSEPEVVPEPEPVDVPEPVTHKHPDVPDTPESDAPGGDTNAAGLAERRSELILRINTGTATADDMRELSEVLTAEADLADSDGDTGLAARKRQAATQWASTADELDAIPDEIPEPEPEVLEPEVVPEPETPEPVEPVPHEITDDGIPVDNPAFKRWAAAETTDTGWTVSGRKVLSYRDPKAYGDGDGQDLWVTEDGEVLGRMARVSGGERRFDSFQEIGGAKGTVAKFSKDSNPERLFDKRKWVPEDSVTYDGPEREVRIGTVRTRQKYPGRPVSQIRVSDTIIDQNQAERTVLAVQERVDGSVDVTVAKTNGQPAARPINFHRPTSGAAIKRDGMWLKDWDPGLAERNAAEAEARRLANEEHQAKVRQVALDAGMPEELMDQWQAYEIVVADPSVAAVSTREIADDLFDGDVGKAYKVLKGLGNLVDGEDVNGEWARGQTDYTGNKATLSWFPVEGTEFNGQPLETQYNRFAEGMGLRAATPEPPTPEPSDGQIPEPEGVQNPELTATVVDLLNVGQLAHTRYGMHGTNPDTGENTKYGWEQLPAGGRIVDGGWRSEPFELIDFESSSGDRQGHMVVRPTGDPGWVSVTLFDDATGTELATSTHDLQSNRHLFFRGLGEQQMFTPDNERLDQLQQVLDERWDEIHKPVTQALDRAAKDILGGRTATGRFKEWVGSSDVTVGTDYHGTVVIEASTGVIEIGDGYDGTGQTIRSFGADGAMIESRDGLPGQQFMAMLEPAVKVQIPENVVPHVIAAVDAAGDRHRSIEDRTAGLVEARAGFVAAMGDPASWAGDPGKVRAVREFGDAMRSLVADAARDVQVVDDDGSAEIAGLQTKADKALGDLLALVPDDLFPERFRALGYDTLADMIAASEISGSGGYGSKYSQTHNLSLQVPTPNGITELVNVELQSRGALGDEVTLGFALTDRGTQYDRIKIEDDGFQKAVRRSRLAADKVVKAEQRRNKLDRSQQVNVSGVTQRQNATAARQILAALGVEFGATGEARKQIQVGSGIQVLGRGNRLKKSKLEARLAETVTLDAAKGKDLALLETGLGYYPQQWVDALGDHQFLVHRRSGKSGAGHNLDLRNIASFTGPLGYSGSLISVPIDAEVHKDTIVHEVGHTMENYVPDLGAVIRAHLDQLHKPDDRKVKLPYTDAYGFEDDIKRRYGQRVYGRSSGGSSSIPGTWAAARDDIRSTEYLTTGMEGLVDTNTDSGHVWGVDPVHDAFILGLLATFHATADTPTPDPARTERTSPDVPDSPVRASWTPPKKALTATAVGEIAARGEPLWDPESRVVAQSDQDTTLVIVGNVVDGTVARYAELEPLSTEQLSEHGGALAIGMWRERKGYRLEESGQEMLGVARRDPEAVARLYARWRAKVKGNKTVANRAHGPIFDEDANPGFVAQVGELWNETLDDPTVAAVIASTGMTIPSVTVGRTELGGPRSGGQPQASFGSGRNAIWVNSRGLAGDPLNVDDRDGPYATGEASFDLAHTVTHELGHAVHEQLNGGDHPADGANTELAKQWETLWNAYHTEYTIGFDMIGPGTDGDKFEQRTELGRRQVSYYSHQNELEGFAETWAAVIHNADRSNAGPEATAMLEFMDALVEAANTGTVDLNTPLMRRTGSDGIPDMFGAPPERRAESLSGFDTPTSDESPVNAGEPL